MYVICVCLCIAHIVLRFCLVFLRLVYIPYMYVANSSGYSIFDCPSVFSNVYFLDIRTLLSRVIKFKYIYS